MDSQQQLLILRAIAVSCLPGFAASDRQAAFSYLQDLKKYESRIRLCLGWLQEPTHAYEQHDITVAVKLFALEIIDTFLVTGYAQCSEVERLELRRTVLVTSLMSHANARVLSRKLAQVLKGLILRDFPQRWIEMHADLFGPMWMDVNGRNVVLAAFKLVAEDCVDSDFNSKISTSRRTDVVKGLNEISRHFLPLFFHLLETSFPALQQSKATLHNMHTYLASEKRTVQSLGIDERTAHQAEKVRRDELIVLIQDTLQTLERLSLALQTTVFLGGGGSKTDFIAAFLHFFREPSLQVEAVTCVEHLVGRSKLSHEEWKRLVRELPAAFEEATQIYSNQERDIKSAETKANGTLNDTTDALVDQLEFHRALSRMLSALISNYLANLTVDADLLAGRGTDCESVSKYLGLLVSFLQHPSGRVLSEQVVMWINIFRDPNLSQSKLMEPFVADILSYFIKHFVRIRWEDVETEAHSHSQLMEASYDDEDDYNTWMHDFRSKASTLFRFIGKHNPSVAAKVLKARVEAVVGAHSNGAPEGFLDVNTKQLSLKSEAVVQFESLVTPLESLLSGIPDWAMSDAAPLKQNHGTERPEVRAIVSSCITDTVTALVRWTPAYVLLKFRHAAILETLRHFWKHDHSTLLQGIDTLIRYLGLPDEWNPAHKPGESMSSEMVSLKKKSGVALVSIAKQAPGHLVPWLSQLSETTRKLLVSDGLIPLNQMHLYEFLSCVATAVDDYRARANFIADVLSDAISTLESPEVQQALASPESLLAALGIYRAAENPNSVADEANVIGVTRFYYRIFNPLNRLLSVGRRCHEAANKKTIIGGVPITNIPPFGGFGEPSFPPDEGLLTIEQLSYSDPFIPLWPRILPIVLNTYRATLGAWRFDLQANLLQNNCQRYIYAISDDEAYLARNQGGKSGGVFGDEGTAGSVITGLDRRKMNLLPKWSGWLTELRNTCFQRVLFSSEFSASYAGVVEVLADPVLLKSMEHRQMSQFLKHVVEFLLISCPSSLYSTHLGPIIGPVLEHMRYRLEKSWLPIISSSGLFNDLPIPATKALCSVDCKIVPMIANRGEEYWCDWSYAHAGVFVGELDSFTSEAVVEKHRVHLSRTFSEVLQACLALKGDWALVLANHWKEELAAKKKSSSNFESGSNAAESVQLNADRTPKMPHRADVDRRKLLRINGLCRYLLLDDERCAGSIALVSIQSLCYPDAYTCTRMIKVCHRILETVAWSPLYSQLLGQHLFGQAVKDVVTEPKWMVGVEWDMINLVRDIYCRLVLGQWLQFGGQGLAQQQPPNREGYEQTKVADKPLEGGGILISPSPYPRQILAGIPSLNNDRMRQFDEDMRAKRSSKDQKYAICDLLRSAADNIQLQHDNQTDGPFSKALLEESLLHDKSRARAIPDIPEKLVIKSANKTGAKENESQPTGLNDLFG